MTVTESVHHEDGVIEVDMSVSHMKATRRSPAETSVEVERAVWIEHYPSDGEKDGEKITDEEFHIVEEWLDEQFF
jgi:hypothetical protein